MENQNINVNVEEQTIVEETKTDEGVKEVKTLEAGEYSAYISLKDKSHQSIYFEIGKHKIKAVKRNCSDKFMNKYQKNTKVKVIIDGTKDSNGDFLVLEIKNCQ